MNINTLGLVCPQYVLTSIAKRERVRVSISRHFECLINSSE